MAKDDSKAAALYTKACEAGSAEGCNGLGTMYEAGRGVGEWSSLADCRTICSYAKDYAKAVALFSKACDAGSADACSNLGIMYLEGNGVTEDDSYALTLYLRACDAGSADGCGNAGIVYRKGYGTRKDAAKAVQFYTKSCSLGSQIGCNALKRKR